MWEIEGRKQIPSYEANNNDHIHRAGVEAEEVLHCCALLHQKHFNVM